MMNNIESTMATTIQIEKEVQEQLCSMKMHSRETYNDVLERMIEDLEELNQETMDEWLNEYYEERGWNVETGRPTKQKLLSLGLESVARELEEMGFIK